LREQFVVRAVAFAAFDEFCAVRGVVDVPLFG
jgi:hypothetical protein